MHMSTSLNLYKVLSDQTFLGGTTPQGAPLRTTPIQVPFFLFALAKSVGTLKLRELHQNHTSSTVYRLKVLTLLSACLFVCPWSSRKYQKVSLV